VASEEIIAAMTGKPSFDDIFFMLYVVFIFMLCVVFIFMLYVLACRK